MANPFETEGMFSWFELMTCDVEEAKKFYGELFDWEFQEDTNPDMSYTLVKTKNSEEPIAGIFDRKDALAPDKEQIPPHWGCYITVHDINSTVEKVKTLGGNIIVPPTQIPKVGFFSVIQDPQGAVISLFEYHLET